MEQLQEFYGMLPPELQEKIAMLEPEEQQQVLMDLMQRYQDSQSEYAQMGANAQGQRVPVEAERNETITVQDGEEPEVEGGYLKKLSENPISGQATYEIPNNEHNNTHESAGNGSTSTGVNMHLKEGDVVNSDKTKIPANFVIDGRNFKGKTFKDASDYISKKENELQKNFNNLTKKGKTDKVSEGSLSLMLAKLATSRNQLNELQEIALSYKEKKEDGMRMGGAIKAQPGVKVGERIPYTLDFQMPNYQYDNLSKGKQSAKLGDNVKDRMVNTYHAPYPVIQAADGVNINDIHSRIAPQTTLKQFMEMTKGLSAGMGDVSLGNVAPLKISTPPKKVFSTIYNTAIENNVDPAFMLTMGHIESRFKPNATSKTGATGLFQFTRGTGQDYGLVGQGFDKRTDLSANTAAAAELIKDNEQALTKLGIPVNPTTLYLAHQQGVGGAAEIYRNAVQGTPISASVLNNMALNFGTISGADYLAKTNKIVMGNYKSFQDLLTKYQEQSDYDAVALKQKFSLGGTVGDISKQIAKVGMENVLKKIKAGNFNPDQYKAMEEPQPQMAYGGFINRPYSMTVPGPDFMGGRRDYILDANYAYGGYAQDGTTASTDSEENIANQLSSLNSQDLNSLINRLNRSKEIGMLPGIRPVTIPATPRLGFQTGSVDPYTSVTYGTNAPIVASATYNPAVSTGEYPDTNVSYVQGMSKSQYPIADYNQWKDFLETLDPNSPEVKAAIQQANKYSKKKGDWKYWATEHKFGNVHKELYPAFQKWQQEQIGPPTVKFNINPQTLQTDITQSSGPDSGKKIASLDIIPKDFQDQNVASVTGDIVTSEYPPAPGEGDLQQPGDKGPSWWDRINYGLREAIPYLDNLRLLREGRIMPTLQQKPYQNPYENLSTDYSIQSFLNDVDRNTLTQMADERGNPSVRNARMAQVYANAVAGKAPLYTQKYNQEQQLKNAKTLGQYDYLNKWTDTNMALKKKYEQEVLQTIENQRQQRHMALDKMANDYLRRQEMDQALALGLANTNYDWDKFRQQLVSNPTKTRAQRDLLKYLIELQGGGNTSKKKSSKEDDDEEDTKEVIIGGQKFTLNPVTQSKSKGGKIKKLSLRNYY